MDKNSGSSAVFVFCLITQPTEKDAPQMQLIHLERSSEILVTCKEATSKQCNTSSLIKLMPASKTLVTIDTNSQ